MIDKKVNGMGVPFTAVSRWATRNRNMFNFIVFKCMKKNCDFLPPRRQKRKFNLFLCMRMIAVLLLVGSLHLSAATFSQTKVSLSMKNAALEEVFQQLETITDYTFLYKLDLLKGCDRVDVDVQEKDFQAFLTSVLKPLGLSFKIDDRVVIITRDEEKKLIFTVCGWVHDEKRQPIPGVTVKLLGVSIGTATNEKGWFSIDLPISKGKLEFSFVGYEKQQVAFSEKTDTLMIVLKEKIQDIGEVVVTGYGNVSKGNYTGASTTVRAKDIMMAGTSSIDQMLQGVIPGMLVMNKTGLVGASPQIRVRGTSTLLGSQEPVWVVDGVVQRDPQPFNSDRNLQFSVEADDIKELAGNAISWLNPNDIETITVLKDASATAIYGSQAANGVIVITTKRATLGRVRFNYSGDFSIGQRPRYGLYNLMNSAEIMQYSKEMYEERVSYPMAILPIGYAGLVRKFLNKEITREEMNKEYKKMALENTDWFDLLFRNSFNHSHNLSISGGSEMLQNRTSFSITENKGEAIGNKEFLFAVTSNTTLRPHPSLDVNLLIKGTYRDVKGFSYGVNPFNYAYNTSRVIPMYNEDGTLFYHEKRGNASYAIEGKSTYNYNIQNELDNTGSENTTRTWGTTVDFRWRLLRGLEYQGLISYNSSSADTKQYATERSFYITSIRGYEFGSVLANGPEMKSTPLPHGGILVTDLSNTSALTIRNSFVYERFFKEKHRVILQIGIETNSTKRKGNSTTRYGYLRDRGETFATPPIIHLQYGGSHEKNNSEYINGANAVLNRVDNTLSEYFSVVYTYDECYVLNFSGRLDASNRFGQDKNKRFEPTWSAGIKWRIVRGNLFREKWWLNNLDLYGSYGYQGNAVSSVSPYLIAYDGGLSGVGRFYQSFVLLIKSLPYPNLGWEKTKTYNVGIDASLFDGRLNFVADIYKKISDVLSSRDVPQENGVENAVVSGSKMENGGYDFVVNLLPVRLRDFTWQLSLNSAVVHNKVNNNDRINTLNDYLNGSAVVEGESASTFYSYEFSGLDSENGTPLFKNMDIEGAKSPIDYLVKTGKFVPDFSGGLNTMFKYRRLSLYVLFALQWGGHKRLPALYPAATFVKYGITAPEQNVPRMLKKRWRVPGDEMKTNIPSFPGVGMTEASLPETETSYSSRINPYYQYDYSDLRVANTDFIKCRSISLSYEISEKLLKTIHAKYASLKLSMTNPFMWVSDKKWEGLDPETGNWPTRRVTSFSLQITF